MSTLQIKDGAGSTKYLKGAGTGTSVDPFIGEKYLKNTGEQKRIITRKLDTVGNGTGAKDMAVDGSTIPVPFLVKPAAGEVLRVARWILTIRDGGSFDSGGWGNNGGSPLDEGLLVEMIQDSVTYPLLDAVKSHVDVASLCYNLSHHSWGSGDEFLVARWTFTATGQYLRLVGDDGDELRVVVRDDLTHLVEQTIYVQGYYE